MLVPLMLSGRTFPEALPGAKAQLMAGPRGLQLSVKAPPLTPEHCGWHPRSLSTVWHTKALIAEGFRLPFKLPSNPAAPRLSEAFVWSTVTSHTHNHRAPVLCTPPAAPGFVLWRSCLFWAW